MYQYYLEESLFSAAKDNALGKDCFSFNSLLQSSLTGQEMLPNLTGKAIKGLQSYSLYHQLPLELWISIG